ncbi:hypothetical protein ORIO_12380 [Cereibacter azotoformans]|uniref:Uncharacterized protein n=1 Tax=Cereibacter sphaeroides (strain ATCC 17025 / ATH 2.4.3) TaxID=349102 RepID=A4WTA5_CERS5|nr:hypothetical protein [Cereibacter azotoformans]ULB10700.1 hypothetical protein ORIO_12380 [Cereibacter azotoformans]
MADLVRDPTEDRALWLRQQLESLPTVSGNYGSEEWRAAWNKRRHATEALADHIRQLPDKPTVREAHDKTTIRMCGISSSSTTGLVGACQNWLRAQSTRSAR